MMCLSKRSMKEELHWTYRSVSKEVDDGLQLPSMRIDKGFIEDIFLFVPDLEDVGEDGRSVFENDVFQLSVDLVPLSIEGVFRSGDSILQGNNGCGIGDVG